MPDLSRTAIVLAAHGDRGSVERNAVLRGHAGRVRDSRGFAAVTFGVLNGEPALADALHEAERVLPQSIMVYPFFMSGGYFVNKVLPERIADAKIGLTVRIIEPLGLDTALPGLVLRRSIETASEAAIAPRQARLLVAAHGSKFGRASAEAAEAVAAAIRAASPFRDVFTAFIEEPPFIAEVLRKAETRTIVAGLFSGEGMHGHDDLLKALAEASAPCAYTRPIGGDPEVTKLIEVALLRALAVQF